MTKDSIWICVVLQSFSSMSICFKLDFVDENLAEIWWDQYINMLKLHGNEMTKKLDVCGRQAGPQSSCQTHFISPSALHRMVMVDLMMINICKKKKNKQRGSMKMTNGTMDTGTGCLNFINSNLININSSFNFSTSSNKNTSAYTMLETKQGLAKWLGLIKRW